MMKKILQISSCFMLLLFVSVGTLQAQTVSGVVVSAEDNEPLPSITVLVKGTNKGIATNIDGEYELNLTNVEFQNGTLVFSGIGFVRQEIAVNSRRTIDVKLATDTQLLDDVVVVGFGSIVREDMTGNIASVTSEELSSVPVNSFETALQGRTSGVFIQNSSSKLGQGINIRVRGTSSVSASSQPLYVIDGIPITSESQSQIADTNPMADLNVNDIESVDILKDASAAAIYGSRGANGVILITTKSGQSGATRINVSYERGYSTETNRVEFLNADEYVELFTEAAQRSPDGDLSGAYLENNWFDYFAQGTDWKNRQVNTDWQDESFQDGSNANFGVQISGGTEKTRFFVSGGFSDQIGIIRSNEFNRMNARLNLDHTASDKFEVGMNLSVSRTENIRVSNDNQFATPLQGSAQSPLSPVYTPEFDGNNNLIGYSDVPNENTLYYNFLRHIKGVDNNQTVFRNIGNLYAKYEISDNLEFRSEAGLDLLFQNEDYFADSHTNTGENTNGYGDSRWVNLVNYTLNNYLTWNQQINDNHQLTTVAGTTFESSNRYQTYVSGTNFPTDSFRKLASAAEITGGNTTETEYKYLSYFARVNYKFSDRYLLSGSARIDGSSRFGDNSRYGFFPAVSAGWIMSEESFLSEMDALSFLKIRASFGLTGNSNVGNFPSRGLYAGTGYAGSSGLIPSQTPNPDLKWERTAQYNIGLDFAFFNDRVGGEIDYYIKQTTDLLLNVNVPATTGYTAQLRNVGELENKGFEFVINTQNTVGVFRWNSSFNIAFNKNEITNLGGQVIEGGFLNRAVEGEPIAVMFGKEYAGVDPSNGDALYYLHSSDGKDYGAGTTNVYANANNVVIGDPNPNFVGGFTNNFNYKNFDLGVLLQFVYGNDIYKGGGRYQSANGDFFDNQTRDQLNRWQKPGDITDVPEARLFGSNGSNPSSRYISDGSYLRLKSVTLGYSLPRGLLNKLQLRDVRIYMSGVNLLTFTNYDGWDPEVNTDLYDLSNNLNIGNDFYSAPQARTISFGINIGF